jgi:hypothetical protein
LLVNPGSVIFVIMEAILIHPENAAQLKTVKAVLKALKVPFEPQTTKLSAHVSASIGKSMAQYEEGQTISLDEFTKRHFTKK